ncbi:MAG: hypothetical protein OEV95_12380 [Gemmatimonadota bacterium]|nr:hypothetical protein [Gemmatimonadota bacterium]MDH5284977.1 hypothetical protein [Gemmatimonadota bacterium]
MKALRSLRSPIACVLLLLYLPACTSTHFVAAPPPAQLVETARPPSIRVTSTTGSTYTMASPMVSGDSLVGTIGSRDATRTVSLALSEIRSASVEQPASITWQVGTPTPARFVEAEHPSSIRVTRADGTILTLKSPVVRGDSLVGAVSSEGPAPSTGVALSDVTSVVMSKTSAGKTLLLIVGLVAVPIVAIAIAISVAPECHTSDCW